MKQDFFENLLKKPPHQKRLFAFIVAFSFSTAIFSFWLFGILSGEGRFAKSSENVVKNSPSPISTMKKNFSQIFEIPKENISRSVSQIRAGLIEILSEGIEEENLELDHEPSRSYDDQNASLEPEQKDPSGIIIRDSN